MASYTITDSFLVGAVGQNNLTVNAYAEARFSTPPAKNAAAPDGNAPDATATTGSSYGNDGSFQLTVSNPGRYWVSVTYSSVTYWKLYTVGGRVLFGSGAPAGTLGYASDMYVDETGGGTYGPKTTAAPYSQLASAIGINSVVIPASATAGTTMVLAVATANANPTLPSGWTQLAAGTDGSNGRYLVATKVAAAGDAGSTLSQSSQFAMQALVVYQGVSAVSLIERASSATGQSLTATEQAAPAGDVLLACLNYTDGGYATPTFTTSVGTVITTANGTTTSDSSSTPVGVALVNVATDGASHSVTFTESGTAGAPAGFGATFLHLQAGTTWPKASQSLLLGAGTTAWTATKTAAYTAAAGDAVPCDTTTATFAVTLRASVANGAPVRVKWVAGTTAPTVVAASGATMDPVASAFANVGESIDYSYNSNTNVWEVV